MTYTSVCDLWTCPPEGVPDVFIAVVLGVVLVIVGTYLVLRLRKP